MTKLRLLLVIFAIAVMPISVMAAVNQDIEKTYNIWAEALSSGKPDNIVGLYDDKAILVATLAAKPIVNQEGRTGYFTKLMKNDKLKVTLGESQIQDLGNNLAVNSGLYTFSYADKEGKIIEIPARFSFVYAKEGDKWLIVNHHSSKVP